HYYLELYKSAMDLKAQTPESLLIPTASSLTFYQRGAWVLVALRETIGERSFKKAIKTYLKKHAFKNVDTHDFFNVVMAKSQLDLENFIRSEEHTSELQSRENLVCRLLLEKKK